MDRTTDHVPDQTDAPRRRGRGPLIVAAAVIVLAAAGLGMWMFGPGPYPLELGQPIDPSRAIGLAEALALEGPARRGRLMIQGQIGEVCRSAGCWFVLQEISEGRLHELFVDLKKRAGFTVRSDVSGRRAIASGTLVGESPDVTLEADGLRVE